MDFDDPSAVTDRDAGEVATRCGPVIDALDAAGISFLVGGSVALHHYAGRRSATQDLDLFVRPHDVGAALEVLRRAGLSTELAHPHWLGKAHAGGYCVDLIFNSGNGLSPVDEAWFAHAAPGTLFGRAVRIVPVEELLWTKLFIMERERYDGADVAHLIRDLAATIDWRRLLARVGAHWRVLLSHLVLFGFIYPTLRDRVPAGLLAELVRRLDAEEAAKAASAPAADPPLCRGTLLSRQQYLRDIGSEGFRDARAAPYGPLSERDIAAWTAAIAGDAARRAS